jgi:hypothetical protein
VPASAAAGAAASQFSAAAQELRDCARALRAVIPGYQATLGPVKALNTRQTWFGQYPDQVASQIDGWSAKLGSGVQALLALAAAWEQRAGQLDQRAAGAHAAALKAAQRAGNGAG